VSDLGEVGDGGVPDPLGRRIVALQFGMFFFNPFQLIEQSVVFEVADFGGRLFVVEPVVMSDLIA